MLMLQRRSGSRSTSASPAKATQAVPESRPVPSSCSSNITDTAQQQLDLRDLPREILGGRGSRRREDEPRVARAPPPCERDGLIGDGVTTIFVFSSLRCWGIAGRWRGSCRRSRY